MAPAMHERPRPLGPPHAGEPVIAFVAVALQEAPPEAIEELLGIRAAASRRISEQNDRWTGAAVSSVVGSDRPEEALLRAPAAGVEHRGAGLVHEDAVRRREVLAHPLGDRLEMEAGAARPVAEGGPVQRDSLAAVDVGLPVKRRVVAELRDNDLGDQRLRR